MGNEQKERKPINKGMMFGIIGGIVVLAIVAVLVIVKLNGGDSAGSTKVQHGVPVDYEADGFLTLGDYKGIEVSVEVSDSDVKDEISSVLEETELYEKIEGTAKSGDKVSINYKGSLDGKLMDDWCSENEYIEIGAEDIFAEFDTSVTGMNTGETKNIEVAIPDDYGDDVVDGKVMQFEITLNYICGNAIPQELTDEFVTEYSEGECTSVDAFNDYVKNNLYQDNVDGIGDDIWTKVIENVTLDKYQKGELNSAVDETMESYKNFAEFSGYTLDELLESIGMTEDDCKDVAKDTALDRMTAKTVAAKEGIKLDDDSYKKLLVESMEYENNEDASMTLDEIADDYKEVYAEDPKDAMLLQYVKNYLVDLSKITGMQS